MKGSITRNIIYIIVAFAIVAGIFIFSSSSSETNVKITSVPSSVEVRQPISISWAVSSPEKKIIGHTAVHYDVESHIGNFSLETSPAASGYPNLIPDYANKQSEIPNTFSAQIMTDISGTIYLRAHAVIDGKHYWSDQKSITITSQASNGSSQSQSGSAGTEPPSIQTKEFTVRGRSFEFDPSSITVSKGDSVKIIFISDESAHNLCVEGHGCTNVVSTGGSDTLEFVASSSGNLKFYCSVDAHRSFGMEGDLIIN